MNNQALLLKTLLLSTSQRNIYKHCKDKKKRTKIMWGMIGFTFLYLMIMAYSILMCIGYGSAGSIQAVPALCALTVSALAFLFTLFKTNGYLFNFKEYDMLMSLPFRTETVAASKFMYMYISSLPWYISISFAMMIGYGIYAHPSFLTYPLWVILSFFLPVIPMLVSAFIGFLIAKVSSGFRHTKMIQTVLIMIFVIFCFCLRFILEDIFRNNRIETVLEDTMEMTANAVKVYFPAGWFVNAVTKPDLISALLLIALSAVLFAIVFRIVGKSYRKINSAMKSHAASKKFTMSAQKKRDVLNSVAFKEYRTMIGSTNYMVNGAMGEILAVILGVLTLFIGFDRIVDLVTNKAPFDHAVLQPAIPFIVYFLTGMFATTACSPSLEGRNYWIIDSLPIRKKQVYQGKMLFNMYLTVPVMVFTTLCMCISARVPLINTILYLI